MKDLARMSVEQTLKTKGIIVGEQFSLYDTDPKKPTELVTFKIKGMDEGYLVHSFLL